MHNLSGAGVGPEAGVGQMGDEDDGNLRPRPLSCDYTFLCAFGFSLEMLEQARALAQHWGADPHSVLISTGVLSADIYAQAVAQVVGVDYLAPEDAVLLGLRPVIVPGGQPNLPSLLCHANGRVMQVVVDPAVFSISALLQLIETLRQQNYTIVFTSARGLRRNILARQGASILTKSVTGLHPKWREQSAVFRLTRFQAAFLIFSAGILAVAVLLWPWSAFYVVTSALTLAFAALVGLRAFALLRFWDKAAPEAKTHKPPRLADQSLPVYTLLVPLLREGRMLPALVRALEALDYPPPKLDIKLILEASDPETISAARAMRLRGNFELIIVPDMPPLTKPKALNYALQFARGQFVAIYDAEDRPEPGQLRDALAAFSCGPPDLACVQARLTFFNVHDNWLTRQFTLEYASLFDGLLPALAARGWPLPLGGTSNHFRTDRLIEVGAWDGFNVTEDADLGFRFARNGLRCGVIGSSTHEEACGSLGPWWRQRSRWMKGWIQTYLVHMRHPGSLVRELGLPRFLIFQTLMGAQILSSLAHPLFTVLVVVELVRGSLTDMPGTLCGTFFWAVALSNLAVGYTASMMLGAQTTKARGIKGLTWAVLSMPVYWIFISFAAYRALFQFITRPHYWEKTEHGLSPMLTKEALSTKA